MEPALTPAMQAIGIPARSNARSTPMCAIPRANPPPKAKPTRAAPSCGACAGDLHRLRSAGHHPASLRPVSTPPPRRHSPSTSAEEWSTIKSDVHSVAPVPSFSPFFVPCGTSRGVAKSVRHAGDRTAAQRLETAGSVLMIGAHPDDENTAVLAYFARGRHFRTGYLSCTRGEGGQNLIGSEQGDLLGVIRTQELLAARKIDGAEQFFTRAIDFGFSK